MTSKLTNAEKGKIQPLLQCDYTISWSLRDKSFVCHFFQHGRHNIFSCETNDRGEAEYFVEDLLSTTQEEIDKLLATFKKQARSPYTWLTFRHRHKLLKKLFLLQHLGLVKVSFD